MKSLDPALRLSAATALLCALTALIASFVMGQLEGPAPDWMLFLGRFHPLIVHLPIGVLLLVSVMEAATFVPLLKARVEPAIELVLYVTALSAVGAFLMGHLLAQGGGYPGGALDWHRRLALVAVLGSASCLFAFSVQAARGWQRGRLLYRGLLGATLGALSLGAHFGGTMTRGENYLAKYAPAPLKPLLGGSAEAKKPAPSASVKPSAEPFVYAQVVAPILEEFCKECHGPEESKGGLRTDSLEALMAGGDEGKAIIVGAGSRSPLVARTQLSTADDDHMPPEDRPQPSPGQMDVIRFWIDRGAGNELRVKDTLAPTTARSVLEGAASKAPTKQPTSTHDPKLEQQANEASDLPSEAAALGGQPEPDDDTPFDDDVNRQELAPASASLPARVASILGDKCEKCHGAEKSKGKLRVDSLAALLKGGKAGAAVVMGNADGSPIIERSRLPLADKKHMPPKKEPQLRAAEVSALVSWIGNASSAATLSAKGSADSPAAISPEPLDAQAVAEPVAGSESEAEPEEPAGASSDEALAEAPYSAGQSGEVALFRDHVLPLLAEKCGDCHSGRDATGDLHVDSYAGLLKGGDEGPAVVPGDPAKSPLLARVLLPHGDSEHMPPADFPQLTEPEAELLRTWIATGAERDFWISPADLPEAVAHLVEASEKKAAPDTATAKTGAAEAATVPPQSAGCSSCAIRGSQGPPPSLVVLGLGIGIGIAMRRRWRPC